VHVAVATMLLKPRYKMGKRTESANTVIGVGIVTRTL
jgi:hypothetical protein